MVRVMEVVATLTSDDITEMDSYEQIWDYYNRK